MERVSDKECDELVQLFKKVKRLSDIQLDRLARKLALDTIQDILRQAEYVQATLKDTTAGAEAQKATAAKKNADAAKFEWSDFYRNICEDVEPRLKEAKHELMVLSDKIVDLKDLQELDPQSRLESLKEHAAAFAQLTAGTNNLSINNHVEAGLFLRAAKEHWDVHSEELAEFGITTWAAFLDNIAVKWSPDWVRKLIAVAEIALIFPNVRFITCVGIGDFVRHAHDFLEYLDMPKHQNERLFWRQQKGELKWSTEINYVARKKGKLSKIGSIGASGHDETLASFEERRNSTTKRLRDTAETDERENAAAEAQNVQESAPAMEAVRDAVGKGDSAPADMVLIVNSSKVKKQKGAVEIT